MLTQLATIAVTDLTQVHPIPTLTRCGHLSQIMLLLKEALPWDSQEAALFGFPFLKDLLKPALVWLLEGQASSSRPWLLFVPDFRSELWQLLSGQLPGRKVFSSLKEVRGEERSEYQCPHGRLVPPKSREALEPHWPVSKWGESPPAADHTH